MITTAASTADVRANAVNGCVALWQMNGAHINANLGVVTIASEWRIVPSSYELL